MPNFYKNRLLLSGSTATVLPVGDDGDRPDYPLTGAIRYNTDLSGIEFYNGSTWINASAGATTYTIDSFVGDGTQTQFTLTSTPSNASQIIVFVGSVYQAPFVQGGGISAYTVAGAQIEFTSAPPNNATVNVILTAN